MGLIDTKQCHIQFGRFIQEARIEKKILQRELAEKVGITQPYLSYLERGERDIDLALAMKICVVLNTDIREFVNKYL